MTTTRESTGAATRVVLSYRAVDAADGGWKLADSDWFDRQVSAPSYLHYLRRAHAGPVAAGDEFEEFVSRGCTSPEDIVVRVEALEGGDAIGAETDIEIVHRQEIVEPA